MSQYKVGEYDIELVQKKMLDILIEVDRVCKKHNIRYVLDSGTLLGAVRHKGFIPWDDDIDIAMLREDYDKFCKVANEELNQPYYFEYDAMNKQFPNIFGKVFDTSTRYVQKNAAHLDAPQNIWLDIFPVDNVIMEKKRMQCRMVASINMVRCIKLKTEKFEPRHILYLPLLILPMKTLNKMADKQMRKYNNQETEFVCPICQSGTSKPAFKRTMFTDTQDADFCELKFPIPVEYYEYLLGYYKHPMELPPESSRHPGHGVVEIKL